MKSKHTRWKTHDDIVAIHNFHYSIIHFVWFIIYLQLLILVHTYKCILLFISVINQSLAWHYPVIKWMFINFWKKLFKNWLNFTSKVIVRSKIYFWWMGDAKITFHKADWCLLGQLTVIWTCVSLINCG